MKKLGSWRLAQLTNPQRMFHLPVKSASHICFTNIEINFFLPFYYLFSISRSSPNYFHSGCFFLRTPDISLRFPSSLRVRMTSISGGAPGRSAFSHIICRLPVDIMFKGKRKQTSTLTDAYSSLFPYSPPARDINRIRVEYKILHMSLSQVSG